MENKNALFILIKSLTKNEKRHFKLFASQHAKTGKGNYIKLFDLLQKEKEYDEHRIRKSLGESKMARNYTILKHNLFGLLLKSLQVHQLGKGGYSIILDHLAYSKILYSKGMHNQALKYLNRAKEKAYVEERFGIILQIINDEELLLESHVGEKWASTRVNDLIVEKKIVNESLMNLSYYKKLYFNIAELVAKWGLLNKPNVSKDISEIINNVSLKSIGEAKSQKAKIYFYYIHFGIAFYYYSDPEKAQEYVSKVISIIKDSTLPINDEVSAIYIKAIYYQGAISLDFDNVNIIKRNIQLLQETKFDSIYLEALRINRLCTLSSTLECALNNFTEVKHLIEGYKEVIADSERKGLGQEYSLVLMANICEILFKSGDYNSTLKWTNSILNNKEIESRFDSVSKVHMINLLTHFQLGNINLIEYQLNSSTYFLQKKSHLYESEKLILKILKHLIKIYPNKLSPKDYLKYDEKCNELKKDVLSKMILRSLNAQDWLKINSFTGE